MKTEQTAVREKKMNPEQPKKVNPNENLDTLDEKSGEEVSLGEGNIFKGIGTFVRQNLVGTSGWAVAVVMGLTLLYNIINDSIQEESKWTSEKIIALVKAVNTEDSSKVESDLQKIGQNARSSVIDKAIAEAYRLTQAGNIDDSIEKWQSIASTAEGIDNDLAAGAWFAVGSQYMPEDEKDGGFLCTLTTDPFFSKDIWTHLFV